jgi:hypothetical protein
MVRMASPEALDGGRLVGVDLDEVLRAGHRQHRLDALLHARQLQAAAARVTWRYRSIRQPMVALST